jgi:hypothetical protein
MDMDVEFNAPEPPSFEERERDQIRDGGADRERPKDPPQPTQGRTPGSAEGERDPAEQSR